MPAVQSRSGAAARTVPNANWQVGVHPVNSTIPSFIAVPIFDLILAVQIAQSTS